MQFCGKTVLVSNRHVFAGGQGELVVRFPRKDGGLERLGVGREWKAHPDGRIDLGASVMTVPPSVKREDLAVTIFNEDTERSKTPPRSFLMRMEELRTGDDVFMLGYPGSIGTVGAMLRETSTPILRTGIVSAKLPGVTSLGPSDPPLKDVMFVDSWMFQGNSGSPVFLRPTIFRPEPDDRPNVDLRRFRIAGVVSAFASWNAGLKEIPLASGRGVVASTNAGLAVVQAADGIEEVVALLPGAKCPPPIPLPTTTTTSTTTTSSTAQ